MEHSVTDQIEAAVEIFLQKFGGDDAGRRLGSFWCLERAAEKVELFGELIGGSFRGAFAEKLRGDARDAGQIGGLGFRASLNENAKPDQWNAGLGHQLDREAIRQNLTSELRQTHIGCECGGCEQCERERDGDFISWSPVWRRGSALRWCDCFR